MNNVFTILFKTEGYKKNVTKIIQLVNIDICAVLFFEDSKVIGGHKKTEIALLVGVFYFSTVMPRPRGALT